MQNSKVPGSECKGCLHLSYSAVCACIFEAYNHSSYFTVRQHVLDTEADV